MSIEQMTDDVINDLWRTAVDQADPTSGNAHFLFARAILADRAAQQRVLAEQAVPAAWRLYQALVTARDHIEMDALRVSHCKDAAAIDAALASPPAPQEAQADSTPLLPVARIRSWTKHGEGHGDLVDWLEGSENLPDGEYDLYLGPQSEQKPVASIYISPNGEREFDDWKHDLPIGRNELFAAPVAQQATEQYEHAFNGWEACKQECDRLRDELEEATQPTASNAGERDIRELLRRARGYVEDAAKRYYDGTDGEATRRSARYLLQQIDRAALATKPQAEQEAAAKVLAYLDDLKDDAAAHIYPSDLAKCNTSECVVEVFSVRVGNGEERSVPLFSREQVADAIRAASNSGGAA